MAKSKFRSSDYLFRPATVGQSIIAAGLKTKVAMVREDKLSIDRINDEGTAYEHRTIHARAA